MERSKSQFFEESMFIYPKKRFKKTFIINNKEKPIKKSKRSTLNSRKSHYLSLALGINNLKKGFFEAGWDPDNLAIYFLNY